MPAVVVVAFAGLPLALILALAALDWLWSRQDRRDRDSRMREWRARHT